MNWHDLSISPDGTHHLTVEGVAAFAERFDAVLKFHPPGLAAVQRGDKAWHVRSDGLAAYERRFVRTFGYYQHLAAVVASDGWHHITVAGDDAYPERYAWCGNFQEGRCSVRDHNGAYHHICTDGSAAYPERWRYVGDYRDGIAVVQAADGRSTHIDRDGKLIHGCWFGDLDVFHKGFARARDEGGWTHIDVRGRPIYSRRFASLEPFYNGQARVERADGALEVIDEAGEAVIELRPPRRSEFAALSADMVGYWKTQTIGAAVRLGVIEELPATEEEVADRRDLHCDRTRRLLRALGELGLALNKAGQWRLTPRGSFLRCDHPLSLADAALEYAGPLSAAWTRLPDALRRNSAWTAPDVFGEVARDEGRHIGHHRMLRSYARHDYAEVCRAFDLRGDERVIDAGGGLGALGRFLLDAYPRAQVTVLERPEVVALAEATHPRLQWRSADLFEAWGINADVVLLSRVLHDWDDAAACRILARARAALPPGGRVYIIEMLMSEGGVAGSLCDLHLLTVTGGRERSEDDFSRLLAATGFRVDGVRTVAALPSVVVGVAS